MSRRLFIGCYSGESQWRNDKNEKWERKCEYKIWWFFVPSWIRVLYRSRARCHRTSSWRRQIIPPLPDAATSFKALISLQVNWLQSKTEPFETGLGREPKHYPMFLLCVRLRSFCCSPHVSAKQFRLFLPFFCEDHTTPRLLLHDSGFGKLVSGF